MMLPVWVQPLDAQALLEQNKGCGFTAKSRKNGLAIKLTFRRAHFALLPDFHSRRGCYQENNYIQSDRYQRSKYLDVYKMDTECIQPVYKMDTQVR